MLNEKFDYFNKEFQGKIISINTFLSIQVALLYTGKSNKDDQFMHEYQTNVRYFSY
jgi:hypothetical protein